MSFLLDTNVLLRLAQRNHLLHSHVLAAVMKLMHRGETLQIVPQNIYEGWVVATRPIVNNGLGVSPARADRLVGRAVRFCQLLPEAPGIYHRWRELVRTYEVSGARAHDARLVAAMKVHGIDNLLTLDEKDFDRSAGKEISVFTPDTVLALFG